MSSDNVRYQPMHMLHLHNLKTAKTTNVHKQPNTYFQCERQHSTFCQNPLVLCWVSFSIFLLSVTLKKSEKTRKNKKNVIFFVVIWECKNGLFLNVFFGFSLLFTIFIDHLPIRRIQYFLIFQILREKFRISTRLFFL